MKRFGKEIREVRRLGNLVLVTPLVVTAAVYPGGEALVIATDTIEARVVTKYDLPLTLAQPFGQNLEKIWRTREITIGSSEAATIITYGLSKPNHHE